MNSYQSKLGEKAVKILFETFYNLQLIKISEIKGKKTPDYKVINKKGDIVANTEVKTCVDITKPCEDNLDITQEKFLEILKKEDRDHRGKLSNHHTKALSQLKEYIDLPTMIVFISFDMTDYIDMDMVLEEHKKLYPFSPMADIYVIVKVNHNITPSNAFEIKEAIRFMYNTDKGKDFLGVNMPPFDDIKNASLLPLTFVV